MGVGKERRYSMFEETKGKLDKITCTSKCETCRYKETYYCNLHDAPLRNVAIGCNKWEME